MNYAKAVANQLSKLFFNADIMTLMVESDKICVYFSYRAKYSTQLCFKNCEFKIIKFKTLLGREKGKVQLISITS